MSLLATCGTLGYVAVAAGWDVRSRRIPNWLSGAALVAALGAALAPGGLGLLPALLGASLGLGALLLPFVFGAVGGGDVKFAAVTGAWLGPRLGLEGLLLGTAVGLFVALGSAAASGRTAEAIRRAAGLAWLAAATLSLASLPQASKEEGQLAPIPYAVPLAAGVAGAVLLDRQGWRLI